MRLSWKKVLITIAAVGIFLSAHPVPALAQISGNTTCPVMRGEKVKEKFSVEYKGEKILFCCRSCVHKFKKNPGAYLKDI